VLPLNTNRISEEYKKQITKSVFQYFMNRTEYQLHITTKNRGFTKDEGHLVSIKIIPNRTEYDLVIELKDLQENKTIRRVKRNMIPKLNLIRSVYLGLKHLYEKIKFIEKSPPERINPKRAKKDKSRAEIERENENKRKIRLSNLKKKRRRMKKNKNQAANKSKSTDSIRYNIAELKKGIDNKVDDKKDQIKTKKEERQRKKNTLLLNKNKNTSDPKNKKVKEFKKKNKKEYSIILVYEQREINSVALTNVINNLNFLNLGSEYNLWTNRKFSSALKANLVYGISQSDTESKVPNYTKIGLDFNKGIIKLFNYLNFGIYRDNFSYITIPNIDLGFITVNTTFWWYQLSLDFYIHRWLNTFVSLGISNSFNSTSDYPNGDPDFSARSVFFQISSSIFKNLRFGLKVSSMSVEGEQEGLAISAKEQKNSVFISYEFI
jgi:hypothetical protein